MRFIIFIFLLASCAQNTRKYADIDEPSPNSNIEELDSSFKQRAEEVKYIANLDFVIESENPLQREVLNSDSTSGGPINEILFLCKNEEVEKGLQKSDNIFYQFKSHPDYWNAIGLCYFEQKQFRKALLFFQKTIDIEPNYAPAINNFGMVYLSQYKPNKAFEAFLAATKKSPTAITPRLNLAQILMSYGLYKKAEIHLANLPEILQVKSLRLIIDYYTKEKANPMKELQKLWSSNLGDPLLSLNLSIILAKSGNVPEAKTVLKSIDKKRITKNQYQQVEKLIEGNL